MTPLVEKPHAQSCIRSEQGILYTGGQLAHCVAIHMCIRFTVYILESRLAGIETVQVQGWSVVEREQAFTELEAAKTLADGHHGCCLTWIYQ